MTERSHLSIGEVLSLLREEFPDVTISKIRFLESQGLVDPERTPSGYRKFYDHDVERLRWILRQQRENFLPLKVIRGRLADPSEELDETGEQQTLAGAGQLFATADIGRAPAEAAFEPASSAHPAATTRRRSAGAALAGQSTSPSGPAAVTAESESEAEPDTDTAATPPASAQPTSSRRPSTPRPEPTRDDTDIFTSEELVRATGCTPALVRELEQFGLITARAVIAGTTHFDRSAVDIARVAAGFAEHGVEVRHLRPWRNSAEREAGLFEQLVMPLLRQRNPDARRQATDTLVALSALGEELRKVLVDDAVRRIR